MCFWFRSLYLEEKAVGNRWLEGWVGPRAGPDTPEESLSPAVIQTAIHRSKKKAKNQIFNSKHETLLLLLLLWGGDRGSTVVKVLCYKS